MKVEVKNYTKKIRGKMILDDITAEFEGGKIYGLYGRNGSGKSMFLRALSGLIRPTSGIVEVDGVKITKDIDFPESLGLIIENIKLQEAFDAKTNLEILANIKKFVTAEDINWELEAVGLDPNDKTKVKAFSLGMNQKLAIAQAIFEHPNLILMDEPTNALDFQSVEDFRKVLEELKNENRMIIIATHSKEDLLALSDEYYEMSAGKLRHSSIDEIK